MVLYNPPRTEEELERLYAEYLEHSEESRKEERRLRAQNKRNAPYTSGENRDKRMNLQFFDAARPEGGRSRRIKYTKEKFFAHIRSMDELANAPNLCSAPPRSDVLIR